MKKFMFAIPALIFLGMASSASALTQKEELGKKLFFDENLSANGKMSCATCHAPETGFTGPDSNITVYPGTIGNRFGNRKPPTVAYAGDSPVLKKVGGLWLGGMFWDGRATGWTLGDPLAEQAQGPFLNPLEQAMPSAKQVCIKVANSDYADLFKQVWGADSLDFVKDVDGTYVKIAKSIAAYERSPEVNPFSSKYDYYLEGNPTTLTDQEARGLELFEEMCSACHISQPGTDGEPPLFTDFSYDNLGTPKNPDNPFYAMPPKWNPDGINWIDPGLGGFLKSVGEEYLAEWGKQKVPTLRNVDKRPYPQFVKAYMHNGVFKSLEEVVHFYNTRDVEGAGWEGVEWGPPEVEETVNEDELGNLGLTPEEEADIVAFLETLSDGYIP